MTLNALGATVILLVAFFPRYECRALERAGVPASPNPESTHPQPLRVLTRLGEEYSLHLADPSYVSLGSPWMMLPSRDDPLHARALRLQLTRLLERRFGSIRALTAGLETRPDGETERERRSEDPPISLDLTFHLLREMMEMSRAEQLAVQAQNNRRMMELFGK